MTVRIFLIALLGSASSVTFAEDPLAAWELDFQIDQKSTIRDFPMEEIDGEELSNAAVEGALLTRVAFEAEQGKPAYSQEKEVSDQRKVEELDTDDLEIQQRATELFQIGQFGEPDTSLPPPTYSIPTGRTYEHLETTTVER